MPVPIICNFCRRPREEVAAMVVAHRVRLAEPLVAICNECVADAAYHSTSWPASSSLPCLTSRST